MYLIIYTKLTNILIHILCYIIINFLLKRLCWKMMFSEKLMTVLWQSGRLWESHLFLSGNVFVLLVCCILLHHMVYMLSTLLYAITKIEGNKWLELNGTHHVILLAKNLHTIKNQVLLAVTDVFTLWESQLNGELVCKNIVIAHNTTFGVPY